MLLCICGGQRAAPSTLWIKLRSAGMTVSALINPLTTSSPFGSKLWLCSCHEIYIKHALYADINHVSSFNTISIYPCQTRDRTEMCVCVCVYLTKERVQHYKVKHLLLSLLDVPWSPHHLHVLPVSLLVDKRTCLCLVSQPIVSTVFPRL